jgi:hypothetical protein
MRLKILIEEYMLPNSTIFGSRRLSARPNGQSQRRICFLPAKNLIFTPQTKNPSHEKNLSVDSR